MASAARKTKESKDQERTSLFVSIVRLLPTKHDALLKLSEDAGVHVNTLYNWAFGSTNNPHDKTMHRVAKALGYDIVLARRKNKVVKFRG